MRANKFTLKKLTYMAMLIVLAVIIHVVESWIPVPLPIPGVKLGFANIITLFALFHTLSHNDTVKKHSSERSGSSISQPSPAMDAFVVLIARILLGALLTGRLTAFIYSLAGGVFAFFAIVAVKRLVTTGQIWVLGVIGAIFHNIGQILMAMLISGTPWLIAYLPILLISGIITGTMTGLVAQLTILRIFQNKSIDI